MTVFNWLCHSVLLCNRKKEKVQSGLHKPHKPVVLMMKCYANHLKNVFITFGSSMSSDNCDWWCKQKVVVLVVLVDWLWELVSLESINKSSWDFISFHPEPESIEYNWLHLCCDYGYVINRFTARLVLGYLRRVCLSMSEQLLLCVEDGE